MNNTINPLIILDALLSAQGYFEMLALAEKIKTGIDAPPSVMHQKVLNAIKEIGVENFADAQGLPITGVHAWLAQQNS